MTKDPAQKGPTGEPPASLDAIEQHDPALDALLRRVDRGASLVASDALTARILSASAFPLAARRRAARTSTADTLAAWVRVAIPLAAAAAIFAAVSLSRIDTRTMADADLLQSDPAALLSAIESDGSSGLAHHVISSDADAGMSLDPESK
jgi:hypothetical protein